MSDDEYTAVIGKLVRLKVWLKPHHHETVNELIETLVKEAEQL